MADEAHITPIDPSYFVDNNGREFDIKGKKYIQYLPRLLPKGVSEKALQDQADMASSVFTVVSVIMILINFGFPGGMEDLLGAFYMIQLGCFFTTYPT